MNEMTSTKTLRNRLGQGDIGLAWLALGNLSMVEAALRSGVDAVVLDLQHGLWERSTLEAAVSSAGRHPLLVRVAANAATDIGQALDAGAEGVIVPLVETARQARRAVSYALYPPHGVRSGGGVRPLGAGFGDYVRTAGLRTTVGIMVETKKGVDNIDEILAVGGVDYIFIGTGDLALSLGEEKVAQGKLDRACAKVLRACQAAGIPCGIFTPTADAARMRAGQGFALTVVANDIAIMEQGFQDARRSYATPARKASGSVVDDLATALLDGKVEVVDLTATLGPETPVLYLPPEFGSNTPRFKSHEISAYDDNGPWWAWNWMELGEHTGTHFDAPVHWVTGRDLPANTTDTIPAKGFVAPVFVIDCTAEVEQNPDFLLTRAGVEAFEAEHGSILPGSWVLMRSGWSSRNGSSESFLNADADGSHTPGPSVDCIQYLVSKGIVGWGTECVGTDAGGAAGLDPAFPAHNLILAAGGYGLASLVNLDRLPPTGAVLIAAPLKIKAGTGSPVRALALVPGDKVVGSY